METDAKVYNEMSGPQVELGSRFIRDLKLSLGDKVLDMGCGTGHLTKYIADIVGPDGLAVGIDPDAERIKIAKENYNSVSNLQFYVGSSAIGFPHDNEPYYDVHVSMGAYHWVSVEEKRIYIRKACQCLKPGGRLAILCAAQLPNDLPHFHSLTKEGYESLFYEVGHFNNVVVNNLTQPFRFESFPEFKRWFKASTHLDSDSYPDFIKKFVIAEDDEHVTYFVPSISITASKN